MGDAEAQAVANTIHSGWVAQGPRVSEFEKKFAEYIGVNEAIAVSSCTAGLHLALHVHGIGPGDEVIVPSFSFIATTNSVIYTGASPVFADVDEVTGNLDVPELDRVLGPQTKAVMVVHQAGVPAELNQIRAWCKARDLLLIEDAACAIGSRYESSLIGSDSHLAVFSFHPRKLLTTGEGGMMVTDSSEIATRLRQLREHGMSVSAADRHASGGTTVEAYLETGFNYRMTDMQAAVGLVQLEKIDRIVRRRRELAETYHRLLDDLDAVRAVTDPTCGATNYQSFWVELQDDMVDRGHVMSFMAERGISTRRGIMAAHLEPACSQFASKPLPVTEHLTRRTMILPLYHQMTSDDQVHVIQALSDALTEQLWPKS